MEAIRSRILRTIPLLVTICLVSIPAQAQYGGGTGEPNDPYQIATAEDLMLVGESPEDYDKHFILTADIDLDPNLPGCKVFAKAVIAPDTDPARDYFQGPSFTGVFCGGGKKILNFTYASTGIDYVGLFGYVRGKSAEIKDLGLIDANIDAVTGNQVGALVGRLQNGAISRCYANDCSVSGSDGVGGLVGWNGSKIWECWSSGKVTGNSLVGGLVGRQWGQIANCYCTASVEGSHVIGGLVGYNLTIVFACYSSGSVSGTTQVGGLIGLGGGGLSSYWDTQTSGVFSSGGGVGKRTALMQSATTFIGWGDKAVWTIDEGRDYPRLRWEDMPGEIITTASPFKSMLGNGTESEPYLICNAEQFLTIGQFPYEWDKHFRLTADIELSEYVDTQFNIIGAAYETPFTGVFDGNGFDIRNFSYSDTEKHFLGLFGYVDGPTAEIKNLGVIDPNINSGSGWYVGGLVGWTDRARITGCYVKGGSVTGGAKVGGLAGVSYCVWSKCHSSARVEGKHDVGGLIGSSAGEVCNCHSSGMTTGNESVGGLVGWNRGMISDCGSSGKVTGKMRTGGLVGYSENYEPLRYDERIMNSYSCCYVEGDSYVGGLLGYKGNGGRVTNSYSKGSVLGNDHVGGLVGYNDLDAEISKCYCTGKVTGIHSWVGGLVGENYWEFIYDPPYYSGYQGGTVRNCFWDKETTGQSSGCGSGEGGLYDVSGKTTAEMQTETTFLEADWDFTNVWGIGENQTYPYLRRYSAADINQDEIVSFSDLAILADNWLTDNTP
ncbi:MAG: GLUG motif-containing protein [Planctomycetota bacterium]|jgi:hypothetical protein